MNKQLSFILLLLSLFLIQPDLQAQNPFKKLGNKVKDKIGLKKSKKSDDSTVAEEESATSAPAAGGTAENSQEVYEEESHEETETPESRAESPFGLPGMSGNNPQNNGPDESLFERTDFDRTPITDMGDSGKGPFKTRSGMIIFEKKTTNAQVDIWVKDTLFFDQHGYRQVRYTHQIQEAEIMNFKNRQESRTIGIVIGDSISSYDPIKRTGVVMANPASDFVYNMSEQQQQQFGKDMGDAMNLERTELGTDVVVDKRCEVSDNTTDMDGMVTKSRIWMYKNIVLKSISSGMGTNNEEEAIVFKEGITVPEWRFLVPKDVQLTRYATFGGRP